MTRAVVSSNPKMIASNLLHRTLAREALPKRAAELLTELAHVAEPLSALSPEFLILVAFKRLRTIPPHGRATASMISFGRRLIANR
jgi:hypothetical protein